jgi:CRP/FNR family cyclic AMP-dependent transcriptional regulator
MNTSLENFLHHVPVMAGLDDEAIGFLSNLAREEHYPAGAVIIGEGETGNRMFFLRTGQVEVVKGHGGPQPVALARFGAGEFFGEMSLVESVVRSASVVAQDAVTVYTLKGADLFRLYEHQPLQYGIVMLNLARDLARRLRALDEKFWHVSH